MNLELAAIVIGGLIFIVIFSLLIAFVRRTIDIEARVRQSGELEAPEGKNWREYFKSIESLFKPLGSVIPRSPEEMSRQEKRLVQAGYRRKDAAILFQGVQLGLALFLAAVMVPAMAPSGMTILAVVLAIFLGAAVPDTWLSYTIKTRQERIQLAIPDALDLAVVCVEAGLGLDQSLLRIADELKLAYPDLSDELHVRNIEVNMGRARAQAFRNLALRTGVEDLKALMAVLIQTDRFGTSVGQALRVFAESLRVKRQQRARERAAKLPVKMVPVMVLFIFPSIFVVVIGPAIIQIITGLIPTLRGE
jgi:tight adherence protein C